MEARGIFVVRQGDDLMINDKKLSVSIATDHIRYIKWMNGEQPEHLLENTDVFINLAGVSLNAGRWTAKQKEKIETSRIETTQEIIRIMQSVTNKPSVFINANAW